MSQDLILAPALPPPNLQEATSQSTQIWQTHLEELFINAEERFPDVVWKVVEPGTEKWLRMRLRPYKSKKVWGHKALVYARAPPSFQSRYSSFLPEVPNIHSGSPPPAQSRFSVDLGESLCTIAGMPSESPSNANPTTLTTSTNPDIFINELEYFYTGRGFPAAFEFGIPPSDSQGGKGGQEHDSETWRIDTLRRDLVFMWRSRLYSDVRLTLTGPASSRHENTTAVFASHRFILMSRSSYFRAALSSEVSEPPTLPLPSPPFTPASLHFTLGFIYAGTLFFFHRTYDLSTAFGILRAALFLDLPSLRDEIQARIAQEMLHGLFHAFIPFEEYEKLKDGKWATGGCRCHQCARRVPRVLEFAMANDVKNIFLERGAQRALVGLFGEGWCTREFANLPPKIHKSILKGVAKRTTPLTVFPLLFAAEGAFAKLDATTKSQGDVVRKLLLRAREVVDQVLCRESAACFVSAEWNELMEGNGMRFGDGQKVEWVMAAVLRGVKELYAPVLYQNLVSLILLRPHPTEAYTPLLPATSHIRVQVEQTRMELLKWIRKRWLTIRQEHGFDSLESWALREISEGIEISTEELLKPTHSNANSHDNHPETASHPCSYNPSMAKSGLLRALSWSVTWHPQSEGARELQERMEQSSPSIRRIASWAGEGLVMNTKWARMVRDSTCGSLVEGPMNRASMASVPSTVGPAESAPSAIQPLFKGPAPLLPAVSLGKLPSKGSGRISIYSECSEGLGKENLAVRDGLWRNSVVAMQLGELMTVPAEGNSPEVQEDVIPLSTTLTPELTLTPDAENEDKGKTLKSTFSTNTIKPIALPSASSSGVATLGRKGSSNAIHTDSTMLSQSLQHEEQSLTPEQSAFNSETLSIQPPIGASLGVGIACIVASQRERFRAYVRYIGELVGESGSWVGVEVPVSARDVRGDGDRWGSDEAWNDGSRDGIRYFEIRSGGLVSGRRYGRGKVSQAVGKKSVDGGVKTMLLQSNKYREDQLGDGPGREAVTRMPGTSLAGLDVGWTESKGLFVRPHQVIDVIGL